MKAICINVEGWYNDNTEEDVDGPSFGEEVTITRTYYSHFSNGYYHDLLEYPPKDEDDGFSISAFALLSDLDETQLKNKKQS